MGGHGGLNILPQKSWNVYNFENREKVRRDEEAAAKEEQLKLEQARRRDAEFRLEKLRQANNAKRKSPPAFESPEKPREAIHTDVAVTTDEDNHINLFKGWDVFQVEGKDQERKRKDEGRSVDKKRRKDQENARIVLPEDEKYRMGYGVAGKDVKKPWYLSATFMADEEIGSKPKRSPERNGETVGKKKKSMQELREERLKRERQERERTEKLLFPGSGELKGKLDASVRNRAPYYNSGYRNGR